MSVFSDIIDSLVTELKGITVKAGYNTDLPDPVTYGHDIVHSKISPAVSLTPNGSASILVEDASDVRLSREIEISVAVSEKTQADNYKTILGISEDLRDLIYTPIDLGTNFLSIFAVDPAEDLIVLHDKGLLFQRWRIIYTETGIKPGTSPGTDVYGSQDVYEQIRSKVYTALSTFMAGSLASLTPKYSYLYDYHRKANLLLNAATIEIIESEVERIGGLASTTVVKHDVVLSIRVHTDYIGGEIKTLANLRLLNSIETYLLENVDLAGGYHIDGTGDINPSEIFEDSGTTGGSMIIKVSKMGDYTQ